MEVPRIRDISERGIPLADERTCIKPLVAITGISLHLTMEEAYGAIIPDLQCFILKPKATLGIALGISEEVITSGCRRSFPILSIQLQHTSPAEGIRRNPSFGICAIQRIL